MARRGDDITASADKALKKFYNTNGRHVWHSVGRGHGPSYEGNEDDEPLYPPVRKQKRATVNELFDDYETEDFDEDDSDE